ncbi:chloride channel protein [Streptomyces orinoci]|uniref:Chloride channel protein n=1 Tax=Streptomyces orinoci TaxID=67339 RepID=A0ABV3JZ45_STRON|nr:chloride channel protein [Streptomyces orinoci]
MVATGPYDKKSETLRLGDFTVGPRMLRITAWALPVGVAGAVAALLLLRLIGLITNLVFRQSFSCALIDPGRQHAPWWLVLSAPALGGLVIGVMARFGSQKIRGHGMPEAIEAILTRGSVIAPRVALLKPVSAAISIGTGGPFGAEGPIIMTGGAIGSLLAQVRHLTASERKTLLVAGAAAGMAATFNSPMAAVLLSVELLLFEWRPRSFVPVVASVAVSTVVRDLLLGNAPLFPATGSVPHLTPLVQLLAVVSGLTGGVLAVAVTWLVYRAEDAFARLPVHWMWWPALGGLVIGIGGLVEPRALGVGYDVIGELLAGRATLSLILSILVVKTLIWSLSLGSGTSGGVLAPVFMIGGALGAWEGMAFPPVTPGFWAMLGLAAVVGGVLRSPLTGVVFTLELTHAWDTAPALLICATSAYALSVLVLRRSVLTEKIARRGLHLTREYVTDPLESYFVHQVMDPRPCTLTEDDILGEALTENLRARLRTARRPQRLIPVLRADGTLLGLVTARSLLPGSAGPRTASGAARPCRLVLHPEMTLRQAASLFAEHTLTSAPVLDRAGGRLVGVLDLPDLLHARRRRLAEERHRERIILRRPRGSAPVMGPVAPAEPSKSQ